MKRSDKQLENTERMLLHERQRDSSWFANMAPRPKRHAEGEDESEPLHRDNGELGFWWYL